MRKYLLLLASLCLAVTGLLAQTKTISGKLTDQSTKEPLIGASVTVKGTTIGTVTDVDGKFKLEVPENSKTVVISYIGYNSKEVSANSNFNNMSLEASYIEGSETVITSTRVSEKLKEAPLQIEKMTSREIKGAASGDFYQSLGNYKGIDIVTTSAGFKVINLRGFSDTRSLRVKQYIDGVDNESPGLNFPVGNLVGANDLDLDNIEVISGAASALYGANAMQGVISMTTKNPYDHQGLSIQLKGGYSTAPGPMYDGQFRYAQAFGKEKKFAFKITGAYSYVKDWQAKDSTFNTYGDIDTVGLPTNVNVSSVIRKLKEEPYGPGTDITQEDHDNYEAFNAWFDFNPWANPGKVKIKAPGYREPLIADYNSKSMKLAASFHYRFKPDLELIASYKFGYGTAVYQSATRYQIKDFTFHQPKIELRGKNFKVSVYGAIEDAGKSYNLGVTGAYITRAGIQNEVVKQFITSYKDSIEKIIGSSLKDCADCVGSEQQAGVKAQAFAQAYKAAMEKFYQPGTKQFDSLFQQFTSDANSLTGTKFFDKSMFFHVDGQYNFDFIKAVDLLAGASYRIYLPNSRGTIFSDTGNVRYKVQEVGGFIQASKKLFKDRLKLIASVRLDKNSNFPVQFSPRISAVYTQKNHTFRFSASRAFRIPTLQEQYLYLQLGDNFLVGNLKGYGTQYTQNSITTLDSLTDFYTIDQLRNQYPEYYNLKTINVKPLKTELVTTFDLGWRGEFMKKLFIDVTAYFSYYQRFLGFTRIAVPLSGKAGEESGLNDIYSSLGDNNDTINYKPLQLYVNLEKGVPSWGANISVQYFVGHGITPYINYTYADLYDKPLTGNGVLQLTGFNTPNHKINIGVTASKVWKGLGFGANFKWVPDYEWQAPFGNGTIKSYHTLDLQVSYEIDKAYSTFRLGGANIYNRKYQSAIGAPYIGGSYYATWTFDFNKFVKN